jgi:hypothetical protein
LSVKEFSGYEARRWPMSGSSKDENATSNFHPARSLWRLVRSHPVLSVAGVVLVAAVMHKQVTGEPLGASLTSPVDWVVIALVVLALGLFATAVYSFLPAITTGVLVRSQRDMTTGMVRSGPWFAVVAGLYAGSLSLCVLLDPKPKENLFTYLLIGLVGLLAASLPVILRERLRRFADRLGELYRLHVRGRVQAAKGWASSRWPRLTRFFRRYSFPFAILVIWLIVTGVVVIISTVTLASVAGTSESMADESATGVAVFLSASLGLVVSYSALVARKNDALYVGYVAIFAVLVIVLLGAMAPIYSLALRAAGAGQYAMKTMWFTAESCEIVSSLTGLTVSMKSGGRCVAEDVFVVSLSESLVVIAASRESANAGCRLRLPRAAFLGGVKDASQVETRKATISSAPGAIPSCP